MLITLTATRRLKKMLVAAPRLSLLRWAGQIYLSVVLVAPLSVLPTSDSVLQIVRAFSTKSMHHRLLPTAQEAELDCCRRTVQRNCLVRLPMLELALLDSTASQQRGQACRWGPIPAVVVVTSLFPVREVVAMVLLRKHLHCSCLRRGRWPGSLSTRSYCI